MPKVLLELINSLDKIIYSHCINEVEPFIYLDLEDVISYYCKYEISLYEHVDYSLAHLIKSLNEKEIDL